MVVFAGGPQGRVIQPIEQRGFAGVGGAEMFEPRREIRAAVATIASSEIAPIGEMTHRLIVDVTGESREAQRLTTAIPDVTCAHE